MAQYTEYLIESYSVITRLWWDSGTFRKMISIGLPTSTYPRRTEQITQSGYHGAAIANALFRDLTEHVKYEC